MNEDKSVKESKESKEDHNKITLPITRPTNEKTDFIDNVRECALDVLSLPMVSTKRKSFKTKLERNKTINDYIDSQLYTAYLKEANSHIKFGITYSYIFYQCFLEL